MEEYQHIWKNIIYHANTMRCHKRNLGKGEINVQWHIRFHGQGDTSVGPWLGSKEWIDEGEGKILSLDLYRELEMDRYSWNR